MKKTKNIGVILFLATLSLMQAGQREKNASQRDGFMVVYKGEDTENQFLSEEISDCSDDEKTGGLVLVLNSHCSSTPCNTFNNEGDSVWESNPSSVTSARSTPVVFLKKVDDLIEAIDNHENKNQESLTIITYKEMEEIITPVVYYKKRIQNSFCDPVFCQYVNIWAQVPKVVGNCVGNSVHALYKTMVMCCLSKEENNDNTRKKT